MQVAAAALGLAWIAVLGAFVYAAVTVKPSVGGIVSAVGTLAIAGAGILYAWRDPGR